MKVSFFLRGNKLQVRVPYKGIYLRLSTGLSAPDHVKFVVDRQSFTGQSQEARYLNSEIERHRGFILDVVKTGYDLKTEYDTFVKPTTPIGNDESYDLLELFQSFLSNAHLGKIKKKDGEKIKSSTIESYRYAVTTLMKYSYKHGSLNLREFNLSNVTDIQKKRQIAEKWNNYFNGFIDYMKLQEFKVNTRSNVMLVTSIIMNHFVKDMFLMLPPVPRVRGVDIPIVVLPEDFLSRFLNDGKYESLTGYMRYTWEVCATILVTTMRISDVIELKWTNLLDTPTGLYLSKPNKKTGAVTNMIIPSQLARVFKENMAKHGQIFTPVGSRQYVMVCYYIPKLFSMYPELHTPVSVSTINTKGEVVSETKNLFDWVKPHMLRKTAITSMLANGISEQHVKFATGHVDDSKSFNKYKAFIDRRFNNELNDYYAKFS